MQSTKITSTSNTKVKEAVNLRDRKHRDESGLTVIDGVKEVSLAIDQDVPIQDIFICPELIKQEKLQEFMTLLKDEKVSIVETNKDVFGKLAFGHRQEGILAVASPRPRPLDSLKVKEKPFFVIVEKLEKPGNLGAIIRTCDAAGVDALLVCDGVTDVYNPNVIRSSLGTVFSVPIASGTNEEILTFLDELDVKICTTVVSAEVIYTQADLDGPLAVAVGNETEGLSDFWKKEADVQLRVPMQGQADSLNVSATTAIIIYEALRQRGFNFIGRT